MSQLQHLKEVTNHAFSHPSYIADDGPAVIGKIATCSYLGDGLWDVWVCNRKDLETGLSERKLTGILSSLESLNNAATGPLQRLTGEAVYPRMPTETLLQAAPVLGIHKRKRANSGAFKKQGSVPAANDESPINCGPASMTPEQRRERLLDAIREHKENTIKAKTRTFK
jgi:hypothetical protein